MIGAFFRKDFLETIGCATREQNAAGGLQTARPILLHRGHAERGGEQNIAADIAGLRPAMRSCLGGSAAADGRERESRKEKRTHRAQTLGKTAPRSIKSR